MTCHCLLTLALVTFALRDGVADIATDKVDVLPGLSSQPSFKHYSGYLKATGTRKLHYWFVESAGNPKTDPLVVWMNGGPGCSSMDGLLNEHGPFLAAGSDGKTLVNNPYSWNTVANMLYLEAPAGVGYSYSVDKNYTTDDDQVSLDNFWALKYFIMHYPEYSKNEFFLTGESYGGVYVPTLAARIVDDKDFNFKGFAVGNGLSEWNMNTNSIMFFGYYHGLWGSTLWSKMLSACCKTTAPLSCNFATPTDPQCTAVVMEAGKIINGLNIYNLYQECYQGPNGDNKTRISPPSIHLLMPHQQQDPLATVPQGKLSVVPPCVDVRGITTYLNRADVRKAIHIPAGLPQWEICSGTVGNSYKMLYKTMRSQYLKILATKKQRILVYNGDVDMACNFLGDQWFAESLDQQVVMNRTFWHYKAKDGSKQVAGFVKHFQNLAVVTVKGSGHMVPQDKPIPALKMFTRFIQGKNY